MKMNEKVSGFKRLIDAAPEELKNSLAQAGAQMSANRWLIGDAVAFGNLVIDLCPYCFIPNARESIFVKVDGNIIFACIKSLICLFKLFLLRVTCSNEKKG